jgi:hypothetical protein
VGDFIFCFFIFAFSPFTPAEYRLLIFAFSPFTPAEYRLLQQLHVLQQVLLHIFVFHVIAL